MTKLFSLNTIKQIGNWFWKGRFYVLSFLVILLTFLYAFGVIKFYPGIIALIMTVLGLLIIYCLLLLDARDFSEQKPNTLRNWIKSFPFPRSDIVGTLDSIIMDARLSAHGTVSISENSTIEMKVEFLLSQVNSIQDSIVNVDNRVNNVESSLKKDVNGLKTKLHNLDSSLKSIIASHVVGNYDLNVFGIIITLCGTIIQYFST